MLYKIISYINSYIKPQTRRTTHFKTYRCFNKQKKNRNTKSFASIINTPDMLADDKCQFGQYEFVLD